MNVQPENNGAEALEAYNRKVAKDHLVGNWIVEPHVSSLIDGPEANCVPHLWKWQTVRSHLTETFEVLPESGGARRNLTFLNPALSRGTTHTLSAGIQLIGPGELAPTHGHSMNALRFVIEGDPAAFTVVNGMQCPMEDYDLIITPSYSWHDHHNTADRHVAWLDVLDVALYLRLNQTFFVPSDTAEQPVRNMAGSAGPGWLRPAPTVAGEMAPVRFPWKETYARLRALADTTDGSPMEGIALEYVNPGAGGPVFPTMSCTIRLLRPGQRTRLCRKTSSAVFFIVAGEGRTTVTDSSLEWRRHDSFAVPNWAWHSHENVSATEDAILFSVSDAAALRALGMYREEMESISRR